MSHFNAMMCAASAIIMMFIFGTCSIFPALGIVYFKQICIIWLASTIPFISLFVLKLKHNLAYRACFVYVIAFLMFVGFIFANILKMVLVAFTISSVTLAALIGLMVIHHQISKHSIDSEEKS